MNDKNSNNKLHQLFKQLPQEIRPERDLWPEIEDRLSAKHDKKILERNELPINPMFNKIIHNYTALSFAAVFIAIIGIAVLIMIYPLNNNKTTDITDKQIAAVEQLENSAREYQKAKKALLQSLADDENGVSEETLQSIKNNIEIIDKAVADIRISLQNDRMDQRMIMQLCSIYQTETQFLIKTGDLLEQVRQ